MSPGPVPEGPLQGPQRELQPDAHLLPTAPGAAAAPDAGDGDLRLALLLCHAGRRPVYPLGLEGLTRGGPETNTRTLRPAHPPSVSLYFLVYFPHWKNVMNCIIQIYLYIVFLMIVCSEGDQTVDEYMIGLSEE